MSFLSTLKRTCFWRPKITGRQLLGREHDLIQYNTRIDRENTKRMSASGQVDLRRAQRRLIENILRPFSRRYFGLTVDAYHLPLAVVHGENQTQAITGNEGLSWNKVKVCLKVS